MLYSRIFPSTISPTHCVRPRAFTDTDLTTSTNARVAHTNENHLDSPSAYTHTYVRTCNTLLPSCLSFSFHPSSPLSLCLFCLFQRGLLAADWVVEACHSGYRPADTPNQPTTLYSSLSFSLSMPASLSLKFFPCLSRLSLDLSVSFFFPSALRRSSLQSPNSPFARRSCSLCI